ncbi:MAG TPA: thioredoxin family protein [Pirellulales bacterium]
MSSLAISIFVQISLLAAVSDNANITIANNSTSNNAVASASPSSAASATTADTSAPRNIASYVYSAAYKDAQDSGKPLVVLVGASWCPACQSMKTSIMPAVAAHGGLEKVSFAFVNTDAQHDLAGQLLSGNMIPQLVMYEKNGDAWTMKRLIGAQSVDSVEGFLRPAAAEVIANKSDTVEKPTMAQKKSETQKPTGAQSAPAAKQPTASRQAAQEYSSAG